MALPRKIHQLPKQDESSRHLTQHKPLQLLVPLCRDDAYNETGGCSRKSSISDIVKNNLNHKHDSQIYECSYQHYHKGSSQINDFYNT